VRASTTGKQQGGCEHYWHRKGAGIHYWQAGVSHSWAKAEKDFFDCSAEKDSEEKRGLWRLHSVMIRLLALLAYIVYWNSYAVFNYWLASQKKFSRPLVSTVGDGDETREQGVSQCNAAES